MTNAPDQKWIGLLKALGSAIAPTTGAGRPDREAKSTTVLRPVVLQLDADSELTRQQLNERLSSLYSGFSRLPPQEPENRVPGDGGLHPVTMGISARAVTTNVQRRTGRLKLPTFRLMQAVVAEIREAEARTPVSQTPQIDPDSLRDAAHGRYWGSSRSDANQPNNGNSWPLLVQLVINLLTAVRFFSRLWARRWNGRLLRPQRTWYKTWASAHAPHPAHDFFVDAAEVIAPLVTGHPSHLSAEDRERGLEQLLLQALLVDLDRWGQPGRLSPWRRRRVTRFVLRLGLPGGAGKEQARKRGVRFVEEYAAAVATIGCGPVVLLADAPAEADVPGERCEMNRVGEKLPLTDAGPRGALVVPLPKQRPMVPSGPPPAPTPRVGPVWEVTLWTAVAAVAATAVVLALPSNGDEEKPAPKQAPPVATDCLGISSSDDVSVPTEAESPLPDLSGEYDKAVAMIEEENANAEAAAAAGRTVRTVAYLGAGATDSSDQLARRSDGAVPEIRGVALAQQEFNEDAAANEDKILLRVEIYDEAGEKYVNGPDVARDIVADAQDPANEGTPNEIIGVVGITQSRTETKQAVGILNSEEIPVITTTATADTMNPGVYFHGMSPPNSREAAITSQFAHQARIVERAAGGCQEAKHAVIVLDPYDLYSEHLGDHFARAFTAGGGSTATVWHSPDVDTPPREPPSGSVWAPSPADMANKVCEELRQQGPTIVYWTARTREFQAFLDQHEDESNCAAEPLTVLGGNELTNAALSGTIEMSSWLRLYHTVHALPASAPRSDVTEGFNREYAAAFGQDDAWRNDGHAAVAYDAVKVLSEAANDAFRVSNRSNVNSETIQVNLSQGIETLGASGYLNFHGPFSRNKPVAVLHHTAAGSEPVLVCGAFTRKESADFWGPDMEFPCPQDDE